MMTTELRAYAAHPDAAVLVQSFPCGVQSIYSSSWLASGWPSFQEAPSRHLSWATFNGPFAGEVDRGVGLRSCKVAVQGGTPIILHDQASKTALVVSQLSRFKTGEMDCTGQLAFGLKGTLKGIPQGFEATWVLQAGQGITRTMEQWGSLLLRRGGKDRISVYGDEIISSLGYWTDNGAYYHYPVTGPTTRAGGYQTEVSRVHEANRADALPFRHWQLDSWWYQKGQGGNGSSRGSGPIGPSLGVFEWVSDPFVFPDGGLPAVQRRVGLPFVLHNRWFAHNNSYLQRGIPASGWTAAAGGVNGSWLALGVLPLDQPAFWKYFFEQQANTHD